RTLGQLPAALDPATVNTAEQTLLELAGRLPADQLAKSARHLRYVTDPDGVRALQAEEARLRRGRELHAIPDIDGWLRLSRRLHPAAARRPRAPLHPPAAPRPGAQDGPAQRTPAQRRADALVELARLGLTNGLCPTQGGAPVTLLVTIDHEALGARASAAGQ